MNEHQGTKRFLGLTLDAVQKDNTDGGITPLQQYKNRQTSRSANLPKNRKRYTTLTDATPCIISKHRLHNAEDKTS